MIGLPVYGCSTTRKPGAAVPGGPAQHVQTHLSNLTVRSFFGTPLQAIDGKYLFDHAGMNLGQSRQVLVDWPVGETDPIVAGDGLTIPGFGTYAVRDFISYPGLCIQLIVDVPPL